MLPVGPDQIYAWAEKLTLITFLVASVVALIKGWIVPGPTHDRVVKERDRYLEAATRGMELANRVTTVVLDKKDGQ